MRATASDTVALSGKAQATLLHQQGLSVQEIATSLELTTAEINSYLRIITTTGGGGTGAAYAATNTSRPLAKTAAGSPA